MKNLSLEYIISIVNSLVGEMLLFFFLKLIWMFWLHM